MTLRPLVLSARLDPTSQATFSALRRSHFPRDRSVLDAHLTLFHHLDGAHQDEIRGTLSEIAATQPRLFFDANRVISLGKGTAVSIECPPLRAIKSRIVKAYTGQLTEQDAHNFKQHSFHITVANKLAADRAKEITAQVEAEWNAMRGEVTGLTLWHYDGGPWEKIADYEFV